MLRCLAQTVKVLSMKGLACRKIRELCFWFLIRGFFLALKLEGVRRPKQKAKQITSHTEHEKGH